MCLIITQKNIGFNNKNKKIAYFIIGDADVTKIY